MRKLLSVLMGVWIVGVIVLAQHHYAFYYDLTGGQDLEITVINPDVWTSNVRADRI